MVKDSECVILTGKIHPMSGIMFNSTMSNLKVITIPFATQKKTTISKHCNYYRPNYLILCTIMSSPAVKSWRGSMQHLHTIVQTVKLNMEDIIMLNTVLPGAHKPRIAGQAASNSAWYNYSNGTCSGPTTSRACPNMETALYTSIPYSWKFSAEAL